MSELMEYLAVDTSSISCLRWIKRPKKSGGIPVGAQAFTCIGNHGYYCGSFKGKQLLAHRVVFYLSNGYWAKEVDHIDGDRTNNNPANLRAVTRSENNHNRIVSGVYRSGRKWFSRIKLNDEDYYLGTFNTRKEARQAYEDAKINLHPTAPARCYEVTNG